MNKGRPTLEQLCHAVLEGSASDAIWPISGLKVRSKPCGNGGAIWRG